MKINIKTIQNIILLTKIKINKERDLAKEWTKKRAKDFFKGNRKDKEKQI